MAGRAARRPPPSEFPLHRLVNQVGVFGLAHTSGSRLGLIDGTLPQDGAHGLLDQARQVALAMMLGKGL